MKAQKGYSLIEIGIGIIIITLFSFCSIALFNGCYNNHRVIQQRNIAISHAIREIEYSLQKDLAELGFTEEMIDRDEILSVASTTSEDLLKEGNYALPEDKVIGPNDATNNMTITTRIRRLPGSKSTAMDSTVSKVIVDVEYKIRANDKESRKVTLEAIKLTV